MFPQHRAWGISAARIGGAVRRPIGILLSVALVLVSVLGSATPALARGACIGPITKSAIYKYADRWDWYLFGGAIKYSEIKLTATFCYDSMGNAWATKTPTVSRVSGAAWAYSIPTPTVVVTSTGAYARFQGYLVMFMDVPGTNLIRVNPRLTINGTTGRWTASDTQSTAITDGGAILTYLNPTFVSARFP